jgi:hypothetical protein
LLKKGNQAANSHGSPPKKFFEMLEFCASLLSDEELDKELLAYRGDAEVAPCNQAFVLEKKRHR